MTQLTSIVVEFNAAMKYHNAVKHLSWFYVALLVGVGAACGQSPTPAQPKSAPTQSEETALPAQQAARQPTAPKQSPPTRPVRPQTPKPTVLPDGVFEGTMSGERLSGEIRLVVRDGVLAFSHVDVLVKRRLELTLKSRGSAADTRLSLHGRQDNSGIQVLGEFLDGERASGTFTGTVYRKRVSGRWYAVRR